MPIATPQGTLDFKSVDKVTFVGASSNTVIDTTTGSLGVGVGVGGPTSNLHVVGNTRLEGDINMLHTANTASIKLNSNVVTEFPRSKKLIKYPRVAMTQNDESGTSGYVTNASTWENQASNQTNGPWNNFNGILNDSAWQSSPRKFNNTSGDWDGTTTAPYAISLVGGTTIYGEWVELKIPNKIQLHTCRIAPMTLSTLPNLGRHRSPRNGYILGRVGAAGNWTVLKSWSDVIDGWEDLVLRDFDIENPSEYYDYFRVVWTAINGNVNYSTSNGPGYASSGEIEFLGVPEYDPEAHGTDVTLKSLTNVPNTDWLEVYYDAKELSTGAVTNPISGLGGTTNNGTAVGDPQVSNGAFVFDGNGDYIYNSQSGYTSGTMYTGCAWIKKASATNGCIFQFGNGSNNSGIGLFSFGSPSETKTMRAFVYGGADADYKEDVPLNEWFHVVAVIYNTDATLYINGVSVATDTRTTTITIPSTPYLSLGVQTNSSNTPFSTTYFDGSIANFRLFNRALTTDEIYQLYAYQKEYFGHGDLSMTLKAGRLGIGTSEPKAVLDVRGDLRIDGHSQLETLAPRYYSSMQRGTFHNVSSHIITGFDHQVEGYTTPVLGWEVHINFNHHRNPYATHVEIDGGYLSTAPSTHVAVSEVGTRKYDEDTSAFSFYSDKFYLGSDIASAHAAAYAVIRITNSQVPGIPSAIHTGNGSTVRYHMLGHTMYVKPGIGSCLDVAIGQIPGGDNARLHGIRVATGADNITGSYTVYTYH